MRRTNAPTFAEVTLAAASTVARSVEDASRQRAERRIARATHRFEIGEVVATNVQGRVLLATVTHWSRPGPGEFLSVRFAHGATSDFELASRWRRATWLQRRRFRAATAS